LAKKRYGSQASSVPGKVIGTALGFTAAWLALSLATLGGTSGEGMSWVVGSAGRGLSSFLSTVFGLSACILPILLGFWGYNRFVGADPKRETRLTVFLLGGAMILVTAVNIVSGLRLTGQAGLISGGLSTWAVKELGPLGSLFMLAALIGILKVGTDVGLKTLRGNLLLRWSLPIVERIASMLRSESAAPVSRYLASFTDNLAKKIGSIVAIFAGLWIASGIAGAYRFLYLSSRDLAIQELGRSTEAMANSLIGGLGHFAWAIPISLVVVGYAGLRRYCLTICAIRSAVLGYFVWSVLFLGTLLTNTSQSNLSGSLGRRLALFLSSYIGETGVMLATLSLCAILVFATRSKILAGFASRSDRELATGALHVLADRTRGLAYAIRSHGAETKEEGKTKDRVTGFFSSIRSSYADWSERRHTMAQQRSEERQVLKEARLREREAEKEARHQEKEALRQAKLEEKEALIRAKLEEKEAVEQAKLEERQAVHEARSGGKEELKAAKLEEKLKKREKIAAERKRRIREAEELKARKQAELEARRAEREQKIAELKAEKKREIEERKAERLAKIEEKRLRREAVVAERKARREAQILEQKAKQEAKIAEQKAKQEAKVLEQEARREAKMAEKLAKQKAAVAAGQAKEKAAPSEIRAKDDNTTGEVVQDEAVLATPSEKKVQAPISESEERERDGHLTIHEFPAGRDESSVKIIDEEMRACVNHRRGGDISEEIGDLAEYRGQKEDRPGDRGEQLEEQHTEEHMEEEKPQVTDEISSETIPGDMAQEGQRVKSQRGKVEKSDSDNIVPFPKPKPRKRKRFSLFGHSGAGRVSRRRLQTKPRPKPVEAGKQRAGIAKIVSMIRRTKKETDKAKPAIKDRPLRHPTKKTNFADIWVQAKSTVVLVVAGSVVLTIGYFALLGPAEENLAELSTLRGAAQEYYLLNAIQRTVGLFWDRTLDEGEESEIPKNVSDMAKEAGLRIESDVTRGASEKVNKQINYTNYSMEFTGSYSELMEFMKSLENYPVFLSVESMELAGDGSGRVHAVLEVHGYTFNANGQD
jgi:hypothetical protein